MRKAFRKNASLIITGVIVFGFIGNTSVFGASGGEMPLATTIPSSSASSTPSPEAAEEPTPTPIATPTSMPEATAEPTPAPSEKSPDSPVTPTTSPEATVSLEPTVSVDPSPMPYEEVIIEDEMIPAGAPDDGGEHTADEDEITVDDEEVGLGTPENGTVDVDTLPKTGDSGSMPFYMAGFIIVLLGVLFRLSARKN